MKQLLLSMIAAAALETLPVEAVTLGNSRIALTETSFAAVARRLGSAPIEHAGDAGDSRAQACYRVGGASPATYYLESSEMGGGELITQLEAVAEGSASIGWDPPIATTCRALPPTTGAARTNRGIVLGMSRAEVERRLKNRGRIATDTVIYEAGEVRRIKGIRFDASSELRVRYFKGRVAAFAASFVLSS